MKWIISIVWLFICAIEGEEPEDKSRSPPFCPLP